MIWNLCKWKNINDIEEAFVKRGLKIIGKKTWPTSWMSYNKIRYVFTTDFKLQQPKEINVSVEKHIENNTNLGEYAIKININDSNNIDLIIGNFVVKNAMVRNFKKVSGGYILYLDNFATYGNTQIELDIKRQGYKFNFNNNKVVAFEVKKHKTPNATVEATGPNSIILKNVTKDMEYRNNFGEWKNISHNNF
ncbi:hypothetical protein [Metamycoplasma alkalescens]|uniref:hypothetical protein n=1 Tax=Metamycoplasma alkalescens TaxID=45363 RepID=UPI00039DEE0C|nr:hypothetical protein [Metamycoplasma alkalescens]